MPEIALARPLRLTKDNGEVVSYPAGFHRDVPKDVADHPYTKLHLVDGNRREAAEAIAAGQNPEAAGADLGARLVEAQAANERLSDELARATNDLAAEKAAHAETRALLEEATAPHGGSSGEAVYTVHRAHQGKYKIMKGDDVVEDGLSKADADAKAEKLNKA